MKIEYRQTDIEGIFIIVLFEKAEAETFSYLFTLKIARRSTAS